MIRRFIIEDLISQDEFGVVFRALDSETGKPVAVRRFFPFGASGGGLHADEQHAYMVALDRLAGLNHPALRSTICGGCDPVDGMPYIATEWVDGEPLASYIEQGPLPARAATDLVAQALEVSELLSHVLGEEAVWVETSPATIIVGSEQSGRGITFWICPLKWLGGLNKSRSLDGIADLTEIMMGWQNRKINDQAGLGLAGWVHWLRNAAATITLHEARETLAASVGVEPPPPVRRVITHANRPPAAKAPRKSSLKASWFINTALALAVIGLGAWQWLRQREFEAMRMYPASTQTLPNKPLAKSPPPAASKSTIAANNPQPAATNPPPSASNPPPRSRPPIPSAIAPTDVDPGDLSETVIPWTDHEFLAKYNGREVIVEGPLQAIKFSESGATMYLLFSVELGKNDTRGSVTMKNAPPDLSEERLTPLIGKKIRLHGTIDVRTVPDVGNSRATRPEIRINNRAAIQQMD